MKDCYLYFVFNYYPILNFIILSLNYYKNFMKLAEPPMRPAPALLCPELQHQLDVARSSATQAPHGRGHGLTVSQHFSCSCWSGCGACSAFFYFANCSLSYYAVSM